VLLKGIQFLLLTRHIVKKHGNEYVHVYVDFFFPLSPTSLLPEKIMSNTPCVLQATGTTGAVEGYTVPVTYKSHRQKTRQ
jgi:hypothetical protein